MGCNQATLKYANDHKLCIYHKLWISNIVAELKYIFFFNHTSIQLLCCHMTSNLQLQMLLVILMCEHVMFCFYVEPMVRAELMEHIPHIAIYCLENVQIFGDPIPTHLLPIVVKYITDSNNQVWCFLCVGYFVIILYFIELKIVF
jgi:hypothetical protein